MASNYTVKITDRLLRFDTTNDDWVVTLLPFAQTPNAPYEVHKTSFGDGNTVTIQPDPKTADFLLPDTSNVVLDDTNNTAIIRIPANGFSPAFVSMGGVSSGGGGGGGGPANVPAPNVTITGPAEIFFRDNNQIEVDVAWAKAGSATAVNFEGVAVYLEDPDISSGPNVPLDGSALLDGSRQLSGQWAPVPAGQITDSPAVLLLDAASGGTAKIRNIRVYLAAYGPYSQPKLIRATESSPTPNIMVEIAQGPSSYQSGMEWAFNIPVVFDSSVPPKQISPAVKVTTDYDRPDPQYYLTFTYDPPDPTTPLPPGVNQFGGCRIVYVQEDSSGNPIFPGTDQAISVPLAQSQNGYKSPAYSAAAGGTKFRVYFCSEDNASPLGSHINSLVAGVTPFAEVSVPLVAPAPDVTNLALTWDFEPQADGTRWAVATVTWALPVPATPRYSGVNLYRVDQLPPRWMASAPTPTTQAKLWVNDWPSAPQTWTIAAISYDQDNKPSADPTQALPPHIPTIPWNIGPPGSTGQGQEFASIGSATGATVTIEQELGSDGVVQMRTHITGWTNPTGDNRFGGMSIGRIISGGALTTASFWDAPLGATSLVTDWEPSPTARSWDFYFVSRDMQGHRNSIVLGYTPSVLNVVFAPMAGQIIASQLPDGWWNPDEFTWPAYPDGQFTANQFIAQKIYVGSILRIGGGTTSDVTDPSFAGQENGQIAVYNASNQIRAWIGEQDNVTTPGQPAHSVYGAWFGELYIGGAGPPTAPIYAQNTGVVIIGGWDFQGGSYPYISVRDNTGIEMGRIGARIGYAASGNQTGAEVTIQGAWFREFAYGGQSFSDWRMLAKTDPTNPLGATVQMRNIGLFTIDYMQNYPTPANPNSAVTLKFGYDAFLGANADTRYYKFPGLAIYRTGTTHGTELIDRGLVINGPSGNQLASLIEFNGDTFGSDAGTFYSVLTLNAPGGTAAVTLAGGAITGGFPGTFVGGGYLNIAGASGAVDFSVGQTGICTALSYAVLAGGKAVIDSAGNWVGNAISGSQTPWASDIAGGGHSLSGVANITASGQVSGGTLYSAGNATVVGTLTVGSFNPASVDVGAGHVYGGYIATNQLPGNVNEVDTGTLKASVSINCTGIIAGDSLFSRSNIETDTGTVIGATFASHGSANALTQNVTISGITLVFLNGLFYGTQ